MMENPKNYSNNTTSETINEMPTSETRVHIHQIDVNHDPTNQGNSLFKIVCKRIILFILMVVVNYVKVAVKESCSSAWCYLLDIFFDIVIKRGCFYLISPVTTLWERCLTCRPGCASSHEQVEV